MQSIINNIQRKENDLLFKIILYIIKKKKKK